MIHADEWEWIVEHSRGDFDHLLLGSSLPFFLTPGLHHIEAWDAKLADRGKWRLTRWIGEKIRQKARDGPLGVLPRLLRAALRSCSARSPPARSATRRRRRRS